MSYLMKTHCKVLVEEVTPVVLDVKKQTEDDPHVHEDDEDDDDHPAVDGHPHQLALCGPARHLRPVSDSRSSQQSAGIRLAATFSKTDKIYRFKSDIH